MSEATSVPETEQTLGEGVNSAQMTRVGTDTPSASRRNPTRTPRRPNTVSTNTPRDFEGVTPKIGGILALRSENMTKKVNYDIFCEKLGVYSMNEFKGGENVVGVTRNHAIDIISSFQTNNKPVELSEEEKKSTIDVEIKKEEIKEYVKDLKLIKSNLKKIYNLVYGNCTDSVRTMLKTYDDYESKSLIFDHEWLFKKVKMIVSGLDTKVNLRVSLHAAVLNYMLMKQYPNETNDTYLTRFRSMIETLKLAGGEHILVSEMLLGKKIENASGAEIYEEKEKFMAICYILRSDVDRYGKLLEDLKSSANRGRDEYPITLTDAFDLLVRESGEFDTVQSYRRFNGRGGRGGRGRGYMFAQRGGRGSDHDYICSRTNENSSSEIVPGSDGIAHQGITCFGCHFLGHYRNQCPYSTRTGSVSMHLGILCAHGKDFHIPLSWLLLDTCSTCDVTNNPALVTDIRTCAPNDRLTAYTNGGEQVYNLVANLKMLPIEVHFKNLQWQLF